MFIPWCRADSSYTARFLYQSGLIGQVGMCACLSGGAHTGYWLMSGSVHACASAKQHCSTPVWGRHAAGRMGPVCTPLAPLIARSTPPPPPCLPADLVHHLYPVMLPLQAVLQIVGTAFYMHFDVTPVCSALTADPSDVILLERAWSQIEQACKHLALFWGMPLAPISAQLPHARTMTPFIM